MSAVAALDANTLEIQHTTTPRRKVAQETLTFGTTFTDHMLECDWTQDTGWARPVIRAYGPLAIDPAASVFHYALECFEGMKAYKDERGNIRLFRPELNMDRMNDSMARLFLPTFDSHQLLECLKVLLRLEQDWIPEGDGYSLYIRPTGISTHPYIGVGASAFAKVYVILSPVGPYYPEGFAPVKLFADDTYVRAWPGGTGNNKIGGNYGPTILPQMEAVKKGYSQILWLYGDEHEMTEVGTMNLFVYWINDQGEKELVTAPLTRGDILPGITRRSILELCREWNEFQVTEKTITLPQVRNALADGRLIEVFGAGTAAVISPVSTIHYQDEDLSIPLNGPNGNTGALTHRLWTVMTDIQYGRVDHPWSVLVA